MKTQPFSLTSTVAMLALLIAGSAPVSFAAVVEGEKNADGSFKKWHRIEVVFDGPEADETPSTFRNHRLDVTFTAPSGRQFQVPGFFDADGEAANTSASSGNKWKARFTGGEEGEWHYTTSFVTGQNVAAKRSGGQRGGSPDGETGSFQIGAQDTSGRDFRAKGKLEYVGEHYLRFADGDAFIKLGANSPEVLLEYGEFDGTPGHDEDLYSPNLGDWKSGDPTWGNGKGKGIIGLINYLSDLGVNGHYFLCMNAYGDGQEAWPWSSADNIDVYDVSKLAQWEILFTHFDRMGLMVHFQLSESENTNYFEAKDGGGSFANARKIFYREMVARFGHHMAITWNLGEENQAPGEGFQQPNTHAQRKEFASWIRALTYYNDHITVHNGPAGVFDNIFPQLIDFEDITGPSLQTYLQKPKRKKIDVLSNHTEVKKWYNLSTEAGHPWVVSVDEPWWGKRPEGLAEMIRKEVIWGALMGGGHMEFYAGKDDVLHIDYRKYEDCWKPMGHAAQFMNVHLADVITQMTPNDDVVEGDDNWALAADGETYLIYLQNGGEAVVDLSAAADATFSVQWFNPRVGGDLIDQSPVTAPAGRVSLGTAPDSPDQDWVILLKRITNDPSLRVSDGSQFQAQKIFPPFSWDTTPLYYMFGDKQRVLTPEEVKFIAQRTDFLCIEKSHGYEELGAAELGAKHEADAFRKANPEIKVLFYFNAALAWPFTSYSQDFTRGRIDSSPELKAFLISDPKTGSLAQKHGAFLFNVLNPDFRRWWVDTVAKGVEEAACDGVFIDQMHGNANLMRGKEKEIEIAMGKLMSELKRKLGPDKILLANNANSRSARYVYPVSDALMFENFSAVHFSKENLLADWQGMLRNAKEGKVSVFRLGVEGHGRGFLRSLPRAEKNEVMPKISQEKLEYSLACYLIGAQPYSYFMYSWGWTLGDGALVDYPDLQRPLGPPKGAYERTTPEGWEFTREFEHANVWVNTETREAKISWQD